MVRTPCCEKLGIKKGKWTAEEDEILVNYIQAHGEGSWRSLPKNAGLQRCGKSCRLRWINYLRPGLKRGNFTIEEETTIVKLHRSLGNRWSEIAGHLPGRTDNELKNYWISHLNRKIYCFRHTYNETATNVVKMTTTKSQQKKGSDQVRCSVAKNGVTGSTTTTDKNNMYEMQERIDLVPSHQHDESNENGGIGEHGSLNESSGVVFPRFEEEIENCVWNSSSDTGKFYDHDSSSLLLSPFDDKWFIDRDWTCESYFDQFCGGEEDMWTSPWDDNIWDYGTKNC